APARAGRPPPPPPGPPPSPFFFPPRRDPSFSPPPPLPGFAQKPAPVAGAPRPSFPPAAPDDQTPEMRVEHVQELIKKLADELNTVTASPSVAERAAAAPVRAPDPAGMINRSVDALEAAARGMHAHRRKKPPAGAREPEVGPAGKEVSARPPTPGSNPGSNPGPVRGPAKGAIPPQLNPQLARIAEAVAAE